MKYAPARLSSIYQGAFMKARLHAVGISAAIGAVGVLGACGSSTPKSPSAAPTTTASTGASTTTTVGASASTTTAASTTTTGANDNFDSCLVVTQAEAATAIGETVTAGVLGNATVEGGLACVFYGPSAPTPTIPNAAQADSVRVVVVHGSDASTWYADYKSKVGAQPITGYGDQAYYDGAASLSILQGSYYLRVAVSPAGAAPSLADEEKLATAVLPKLQ
jgi:hypothetical protein